MKEMRENKEGRREMKEGKREMKRGLIVITAEMKGGLTVITTEMKGELIVTTVKMKGGLTVITAETKEEMAVITEMKGGMKVVTREMRDGMTVTTEMRDGISVITAETKDVVLKVGSIMGTKQWSQDMIGMIATRKSLEGAVRYLDVREVKAGRIQDDDVKRRARKRNEAEEALPSNRYAIPREESNQLCGTFFPAIPVYKTWLLI